MNKQKKKSRKWYKQCIISVIAVLLLLSITACNNSDNNGSTTKKSKKIPIKIEDIEWSVGEAIVDGERAVVFNYTNNTKYTIADIELKFTQKDGITTDDLAVFNDYKEKYDKDDKEMAKIYVLGYNRKFAEPGEALTNSPCVINGTYIPVDNIKQYEIMQPDMATISYIDGNKAYILYYDFKSQQFSWGNDGEGADIYKWAEGELSTIIPQPNVPSVSCSESDTRLGFTSYGASKENFKEYVQACKDKGFTSNPSSGETYYNAENLEGYELHISYYANDERLDGNLYAPDKKETNQQTENSTIQTSDSSSNSESWKQFLKDYEEWVDKYVEFMKKYKANPTDTNLLSEYGKFVAETAEWAQKAQNYENDLKQDNVSSEIITEYTNTLARITKKITEIAD